ncbi:hypothetical protein DZD18_09470 [Rhodobacteraceae bacterium W635]|nr:hypothetical protein DZD18_09470 [Rhodobacteraceae bacterium W635]
MSLVAQGEARATASAAGTLATFDLKRFGNFNGAIRRDGALLVAYTPAEQARVADEVAALPEGAAIMEWLADYAVMREQARVCSGQ